ncbi:protein SOSEKI 1-like [Salvia miltiorrhiza]|uniref:protein SOSEKI 1-like n=1 Tax=Salvia miltiorrhiza TaxID=226208 RepID=UPI0025AD8110|nr:protein SOSEKI 1-like [Salvia miltiorrhiza]XP_057807590.1 protein SOSEKI 1-like [Salvia miltiorrhiza]XP_057807591.1 protein SOSEKI 1-like [Salvia miltiorrhiza]
METQTLTQGGAEVRRLHIVYFLSRKGRIEHPHLFRVHHLSRNGVRLRDVKRWLAELRGKEIPASFSWSYKRRYKTGFVWQDLLDDDLITPISDNEYVLKGSEICSTNIKEYSYTEEKVGKQRDEACLEQEEDKTLCKEETQSDPTVEVSTKSASEIEEESPSFGSETSTTTDESGKADAAKEEKATSNDKVGRPWPFYSTLLSKKRSKNDDKAAVVAVELCKKSSTPQCSKSRSNTSKMLKNLITCGDVETNESAVKVLPVKKQNKAFLSMCSGDVGNVHTAALCRRDSGFGGSQRAFEIPTWTHQYFSGRRSLDGIEDLRKSKSKSTACAAYKPVNGPSCSQCGKVFKPEKMHAHMRSCKGLKALSKCAAADDKEASKGSGDSFSGHLLTH